MELMRRGSRCGQVVGWKRRGMVANRRHPRERAAQVGKQAAQQQQECSCVQTTARPVCVTACVPHGPGWPQHLAGC